MLRLIGVVMVVVILAAGCSGDDDAGVVVGPTSSAGEGSTPELSPSSESGATVAPVGSPEPNTSSPIPQTSAPAASPDSSAAAPVVRVIDDEPRNPTSWSDEYGMPPDGFVPIGVGYGIDDLPWILYWVGLEAYPDPESLPAEVAEVIGWGSIRLARCEDPDCSGNVELTYEVTTTIWLGGPGALDVGVLDDGSLIMSVSEMWPSSQSGPGNLPGQRLLVVCGDVQCSDVVVQPFSEVINDPLDPGVSPHGQPQVAVSGSGQPVIAYLTGPNEAEVLRVAACGDRLCDTFDAVVEIDQPVIWFELFIDAQGQPAVLYRRWNEDAIWLATCTDTECSSEPDSVLLIDEPGNIWPLTTPNTNPAFWFAPYEPGPNEASQLAFNAEPVEMAVIECLDALCEQTRTVSALDEIDSIPTNLAFPGDAFCGQPVSVGLDGPPIISWCGDDGTRSVVRCDEPTCRTGTETSVPAEIGGIFAHILYTANNGPILAVGGETEGLRLVYIGRLDE